MRRDRTRHAPTAGIALALVLFGAAARAYPGGTTASRATAGYSWAHNFVSSLFAARALNGAPNAARPLAVAAMLALCGSAAVLFAGLARRAPSRAHRKAVEIGGIGAAVYGVLVVTPMHDLMVDLSLAFSLTAMLATTHGLYVERRRSLALWGAVAVVLTLVAAVMYYGRIGYALLPVVQKAGLAASVAWLVCTYDACVRDTPPAPETDASAPRPALPPATG